MAAGQVDEASERVRAVIEGRAQFTTLSLDERAEAHRLIDEAIRRRAVEAQFGARTN